MVKNLTETVIRPFAQANGGVTNYMSSTKDSANAELGARLNSGNLRAEVAGKLGTDVGARAEVGYTLPLSNKVGLDFNAGANYSRRLADKNTVCSTQNNTISGNVPLPDDLENININYTIDNPTHITAKYSPDMYRGYAGAGVKIAPNNKFNVTLGVEGGVRGNTTKDIAVTNDKTYSIPIDVKIPDGNITGNIEASTNSKVTFKLRKSEAYVTPKIAAEYNLNKNLSFKANASLNGAQAGVCWTF